ncbi:MULTISPECIES: 16S rRNA (guanine(966)-N(2))-methyltransferase RsmD [unclassified Methylophilus]|uniref:16S rRNA (guanine(966)-N(2))-methyltransferase RsmD n=1 Tax=unclassified Methylophilus TaxID=2630143 RepID=UPI000380C1F3|nr:MULTISPECIES: 16S rRNA (guanine(966)-N(2))-methyltransferase RsmD [unclassified Methylophilus]
MNQVRLNAGVWRSRILKFPDAEGLRPTSDRVRQTLFNWLGQEMTGKACLDLFAGTGALGFEALSRNARQVTMLELVKAPFQALLQNQRLLGATQAEIRQMDALQFLAQNKQRYDVIFCDPPYHKQWLDKLLPQLASHLADDGLLYVEAEYALKSDSGWQVIKSGKAGQVFYHLLQPVKA